jgi:nitric oxide synthase-interacting protein
MLSHPRKTITHQKVILLKNTGTLMIEQAAKDLAYPSMTCPLTGKSFTQADVLEVKPALSGKAAGGGIIGKVHKLTRN